VTTLEQCGYGEAETPEKSGRQVVRNVSRKGGNARPNCRNRSSSSGEGGANLECGALKRLAITWAGRRNSSIKTLSQKQI